LRSQTSVNYATRRHLHAWPLRAMLVEIGIGLVRNAKHDVTSVSCTSVHKKQRMRSVQESLENCPNQMPGMEKLDHDLQSLELVLGIRYTA
jgi:hypothetical protein